VEASLLLGFSNLYNSVCYAEHRTEQRHYCDVRIRLMGNIHKLLLSHKECLTAAVRVSSHLTISSCLPYKCWHNAFTYF